MLKDVWNKGKCLLGFHVGEWRYSREGGCDQVQSCERCGTESTRVDHVWGDWAFVLEDACELERVCARCKEQEVEIEHEWQEPAYRDSDSCLQVQSCSRCGEEEPTDTVHLWDAWEYVNAEDCVQVEVCTRCREHGANTRREHHWQDPQHSAFYETEVRVCRRCAEMFFDAGEAEGHETAVSMQAVDTAVVDLSCAKSRWQTEQSLGSGRVALFSKTAERYFKFAHDQFSKQHTESLQNVQVMMASCREIGIDATMDRIFGPEAQPSADPVPATTPARSSRSEHSRAGSQLDRQLVGHWRHTDSMVSDGFSMATDTHFVLDQNGQFYRYSETAGSMGNSQTPRESGQWSIVDGRLFMRYSGGDTLSYVYEVHPDSLFLPEESHFRLWSRVG